MKCVAILLMLVCVAFAGKTVKTVCESRNDVKLKMFRGDAFNMFFPCKYWALKRQVCGKWQISLSPGIRWLGKNYFLDSVWLSANHTTENKKWEGRITNKVATKYFNNETSADMFNQKNLGDSESVTTDELFITSVDKQKKKVLAKERESGDFTFSFTPWNPNIKGFNHALFKFDCNADLSDVPYPDQMCGNQTKGVVLDRAKTVFSLDNRFDFLVIYYDLFSNTDVVQTNEKCTEAVQIFGEICGSPTKKMEALKQCHQILSSQKHTECVTLYSCDPMDIFNACLRWVCGGYQKKDPNCEVVGEGIDMCPRFESSGNLTDRMTAAGCYKDFLPIEVKSEV